MYLLSFKIAPAIAAGCTVVCKPSEMTSLTAYMLAKVMNEAGKVKEKENTLSTAQLGQHNFSISYIC